jgi:predicted DNA-binding transcriptional regulator YafY
MADRIDKTQRLLDVIAYLVGRRQPATVEELLEAVPAYAGKWVGGDETARASVRRMFERDKDELRDAGIPLETVPLHDAEAPAGVMEGYRLRTRDFFLPYLRVIGAGSPPPSARERARYGMVELAADEAVAAREALRQVADLTSFPLRREARQALRKLSFDLGAVPLGAAAAGAPVLFAEREEADAIRDRVEALSEALIDRKRVRFRYHGIRRGETTERDVAPYGMMFQHGNWYLAGHDALRDDVRLFRVARMETPVPNRASPKSADYEIPGGFTLDAFRGREAWELGTDDDEALEARVRFTFPLSLWTERNGLGTLEEEGADGTQVRSFRVTQTQPFLRWLLGLGGEAMLEGPPELVAGLRELARDVVAVYESGAAHG